MGEDAVAPVSGKIYEWAAWTPSLLSLFSNPILIAHMPWLHIAPCGEALGGVVPSGVAAGGACAPWRNPWTGLV